MPAPIPREFNYSAANIGLVAAVIIIPAPLSINFPAPSSLTLVLTHLTAQEVSINGAPLRSTSIIVYDDVTSIFDWQMINNAAQNGAGGSDIAYFDQDVFLQATPGNRMVIQFGNNVTASQGQRIAVRGYAV